MKKALIWIICALALAGLIAGASVLYSELGDKYGSDSVDEVQPPTNNENNEEDDSHDHDSNPAPDFTVLDTNGNEIKLSDMKGKPVVVNFWATWCIYCKEEMPDFESIYNKYKDDVVFMMVNMTYGAETIEKASDYIDEQGYTFPVYFDTKQEAAYAYSVTSLPVTYFIDADGNLVAYGRSMLSANDLENGIKMITK